MILKMTAIICFFVVVCASYIQGTEASHFRGGIVTWKPTNNNNQIEIAYRMSWRRGSVYCDDDTINYNHLVGAGQGVLECKQNYQIISNLELYCTDYSATEDWTTGVNTLTYNVPMTSFDMIFSSCCWISLNNGGGSWSLEASVNLTRREDTGLINSSPITAMSPIVRAKYGCSHTINIPTTDPDGDEVRCRWPATSDESGDIYPPMGMTLNERGCSLTFNANSIGWSGVAVVLEDFASPSSNTPLSKIPLQFLIHVASSSDPCSEKPEFVDPSPTDGDIIHVWYNKTFTTMIRAKSASPDSPLIEIDTVSPQGLVKSPLQQVLNSPIEFYTIVTWTPKQSQEGPHIFCFTAVDLNGYTSDQHCITLVVCAFGPSFDVRSSHPAAGSLVPTVPEFWEAGFDKEFFLPNGTAYIRFYDSDSTEIYSLNTATSPYVFDHLKYATLSFKTPGINLQNGGSYYILMDQGVVIGTDQCVADSPALSDPSVWSFNYGNLPLRLINGTTPDEGRVEIFYQGQWGTVCDDYSFWGSEEASVVCRQLGYPEGYYQGTIESSYGGGDAATPIWLSNVRCTGNEDSIEACDHTGLGIDNCGYHYYDVGVMCYDCNDTLTSPGSLSSPNFPGKYPNQVICSTLITAYPGMRVVLTFHTFQLEDDYNCAYDSLSIYDGDDTSWLIGRYCGRNLPQPIISSGQHLYLEFSSDTSVQDNGFDASFVFFNDATTYPNPTDRSTTAFHNPTDRSTTAFHNPTDRPTTAIHNPTDRPTTAIYNPTDRPTTAIHNPTNHPSADLTCADNTMTVYVPRSVIGDVDADNLHFIDRSCVGTDYNSTHVRLTTPLDQCGTAMEVQDDYVVFSNIVIDDALPVTPGNVITRDRDLEIPVECNMERDGLGSISFHPDTSKIIFREEGYGKFSFQLQLYPDHYYNTPYPPEAYPIDVNLRDDLYFEARVSAEPGLELFVETCVATPTINPYSTPQYYFLQDGCSQDNTLQFYSSSDPMVERFGLEAFAFVDTHTPVYAHCFLMLCNISDPTSRCALGCQPSVSKRDVSKREATSGSKSYVMSEGPLKFIRGDEESHVYRPQNDIMEPDDMSSQLGYLAGAIGCITLCLLAAVGVVFKSRQKTSDGYMPLSTDE